MAITMIISLYSTRLILSSLGASDFGIFNVVGGAIAMMGFLNSTMAHVTQRFISFAEGRGDIESKRAIFNVSLILHIIIATLTIILLLSVMYPLFNSIFNIEESRISAAVIIYISLIFSTFLTIVNAPYDAVMNAHENMFYYSIIGVVESLLKLSVAIICVYTDKDKLVVYGILMACVPLITLTVMKLYCHHHYDECIIAPIRYWDKSLARQISSYFGWNFLTAISSLLSAQGIGIVLNHYFGAALNASQGIANQVYGSISNFSGNMKKALNPVITKSAGAENINSLNHIASVGCKFSTLLTMLFAIPLSLEVDYVLDLWLKEVPDWAATFVVMQLLLGIIVQMADSASTAIYAQGDIKTYAIWKSVTNTLPIFFVWLAFVLGGGPLWLYIPMIIVWAIGGNIVIISYANIKCGLNIYIYNREVIFPVFFTAMLMYITGIIPLFYLEQSFLRLILTCIATTVGMLMASVSFAITKEEQLQLVLFVKGMFKNK